MNKEFIPYEQALALKELGFDEPCFATYDEDRNFELQDFLQTYETFPSHIVAAPTFSQAFRWFREKHNLHGCVDLHVSNPTHWYIRIDNIVENDYLYHSEDENLKFNTYEEAELACLRKLIEIVKS